jgi:hypothetical protein
LREQGDAWRWSRGSWWRRSRGTSGGNAEVRVCMSLVWIVDVCKCCFNTDSFCALFAVVPPEPTWEAALKRGPGRAGDPARPLDGPSSSSLRTTARRALLRRRRSQRRVLLRRRRSQDARAGAQATRAPRRTPCPLHRRKCGEREGGASARAPPTTDGAGRLIPRREHVQRRGGAGRISRAARPGLR